MNFNYFIPESQVVENMLRVGHVAVAYNEFMVVWGGYNDGTTTSNTTYFPGEEIWLYDTTIEKWYRQKCKGENFPKNTSGCSAVLVDDQLFVFGGYTLNGNTNRLYCLDLSTLEWRLVNTDKSNLKPIPCDKLVGWCYERSLYFFGGYGQPPNPSEVQMNSNEYCFVPDLHTQFNDIGRGWNKLLSKFDLESETWSFPNYKNLAPVARAAHSAVVIKNLVYIFGGRHCSLRLDDLYTFNMDTMTWSQRLKPKGPGPKGRSWHTLTALNDNLLLLYGGYSQQNEPLGDCWLLNLNELSWTKLDLGFVKNRTWHTAVMVNPGEVIIYGGCSWNILNHMPRRNEELMTEMIVIRCTPKTLFRLCIDVAVSNYPSIKSLLVTLPKSVEDVIKLRRESL